ncbi:MAG TPA: sugar ABC transporter permease [Candidatus Marinimicrobia bacterium]|nr:sugar ABC transporter permease [Bacteroidota bacterium]HDY75901.1 sugar ABC transporter permease [Candidatus Neomarinimicrobiota bacterium]
MSKRKKNLLPYIMVSPYLIFFMAFIAFPVIFSLILTFFKWNIIGRMEWIGFGNWVHLLNDRLFWKTILNTFKFLIIHIPLQIIVALVLAEVLNQKIFMRGFFRAAFFMPFVISGVVVTILWQQLLGYETGVLNRMLVAIGLGKVGWLIDPRIAMVSIAVMATWKNVGLYVILFLVGLQTVPKQYYEAADLEGASHWQKFINITVPMINPTIFIVVVLSTIGGFSLFIEPYILTGGGPLNSTLSAVLYIYKQAFEYYRMGYSATLGVFFAIMVMLVVILQQKFVEQDI